MDMLLKGKRALITGSTSGIGAQCARVLAGEGVSVVINGRSGIGQQPLRRKSVNLAARQNLFLAM
jgi:NAD(P)-dependent dehydrogenase (short-subunit alcohol dehydrogenase family)